MKKALMAVVLMVITVFIFAQTHEKNRIFSIQASPLLFTSDIVILSIPKGEDQYGFLLGFEFQYAFNEYLVVSLEPRFGMGKGISFSHGYGTNSASLEGYGEPDEYKLFSINPGILIKPFGTGLKGWYIGIYPTLGWKNISRDEFNELRGYTWSSIGGYTYYYDNYPAVNDNFLILGITGGSGYQWVLKNGFTISLGGAFGKTWDIAISDNTGKYDNDKLLFDFILNFKIGYSF
jgi:hypothetical protein